MGFDGSLHCFWVTGCGCGRGYYVQQSHVHAISITIILLVNDITCEIMWTGFTCSLNIHVQADCLLSSELCFHYRVGDMILVMKCRCFWSHISRILNSVDHIWEFKANFQEARKYREFWYALPLNTIFGEGKLYCSLDSYKKYETRADSKER